ncbi:MAG: nitrate reductase cytochrome c-type subunit [Campylobacteraceae bacterium]|nr:nitrate reductase cytochrome c-type subunit [Campylobacteraceae bacterium]
MKLAKLTLVLGFGVAIFITGCTTDKAISNESVVFVQKTKVTENSLGLRKTNLYTENTTVAQKTEYGKDAPGTSQRFKRAYQNAPPMIPHNTEGLLPITINNNACLGCHEPSVAPFVKSTPIPKSHFIDFRPKHKFDGETFTKVIDNMKNETSIKILDVVSNARFNCTQCHAPQSNGNLAVESTFEAEYTRKDGSTKSTWSEVILDDLDTLKKK